MEDLIKREDAIKAVEECLKLLARPRYTVKTAIEAIPSVDTDISEYSDKLWRNAYERGKADGAMIYGNEHNCIMTIFGECSYAETGCGDCAVVEKVRKALSADRPQGWIPCSERLPSEEKATYLVCTDSERMCSCRWTNVSPFWTDHTTEWHWCIFDIPQYSKVVAWMPLKPWKGADDE